MILLKKISIKVEKIEVIKNWLKLKSVHNIQVFLGFGKIAILFILMLKISKLFNKPAFNKNNNSKSAFNKNKNNK